MKNSLEVILKTKDTSKKDLKNEPKNTKKAHDLTMESFTFYIKPKKSKQKRRPSRSRISHILSVKPFLHSNEDCKNKQSDLGKQEPKSDKK